MLLLLMLPVRVLFAVTAAAAVLLQPARKSHYSSHTFANSHTFDFTHWLV
jgi:hypothetical protein